MERIHKIVGFHTLVIDGQRYNVLDLPKERRKIYYGDANGPTLEIRIDPTLPPSRIATTLIHEILHILFSGLSRIILPTQTFKKSEEACIEYFSLGFYAVLLNNPKFIIFLSHALRNHP